MTGIWEFPELEALERFILDGIGQARQIGIDISEEEEDETQIEILQRISLERILVVDEWGMGTAEIGQDPLRVLLFFDIDGVESESTFPPFDRIARLITQTFIQLINDEILIPPEPSTEWFSRLDPEPRPMDRFEDVASLALGRGQGNTIYDMTREEAIQFTEPPEPERPGERPPRRPFSELPRIPLQSLRERVREPEPEEVEPELEPEPEPEPEPAPLTIQDRIDRAFDNFEIDNKLDIPAGKPTRRVERRELFDFEIRMSMTQQSLLQLDEFSPGEQIRGAIGSAIQFNTVGRRNPALTFPRTGLYVKHYLTENGPQYVMQLYRDLVVYSGFISGFYGMKLQPGRYSSFRSFMYRLYQVGERDGPTLVKRLSQQQAAARGLSVTPDHPTIPGEKAPWLADRQYYAIEEENFDSPAWEDVVEFISEGVEQEA